MEKSLREDQIADLAVLMANPKTMLLSDPGTGKTPTVCVLQWWLWSEKGVGTAWLMPKSLLYKNRKELLEWSEFTEDDVVIVDGSAAQVRKQLSSGAKVFLMGFTRFAKCWRDLPEYVQAVHVDEWHMGFSGHGSQRTGQLYEAFRTRMKWFVPMTGTMIKGSLDSAYPAIHIINPSYYPSFNAFKNQHSLRDEYDRAILWFNTEKIAKIFGKHGIRRTFESIFGKQEIVIQSEICEMSKKHREIFEKFKAQAYLELDKFFIDGTLPGVGFIRGRQIQEHPNHFPDLTDVDEEGNLLSNHKWVDMLHKEKPGKLESLSVHLTDHKELNKPLVIFSAMVPQQRQIVQLVKDHDMSVELLNGSVSMKKRGEIDEKFQRGEIQVLVCSPAVAAFGFNWQDWGDQEVDHTIFVTTDFNDDSFLQACRRFIRRQRKTPLRVTVLQYENSIDQRVFQINEAKSRLANSVDPSRPVVVLGS